MRTPSATEVLQVWERGLAQTSAERALVLAALACPEQPTEALAQLPIGQRDRLLLQLRDRLLGSRLTSLATCPQCGEAAELSFDSAEILATACFDGTSPAHTTTTDGEVHFRLPNSADLLAITGLERASARRRLFERCILRVEQGGEPKPVEQLSEETLAAVAAQMAQIDSQAEVQLELACPVCARHWLAPLDILAYLWSEINAWAGRTLREIHLLASAYGWRESEVLALSPTRRQLYLQMIGN